jgi:flagellar biosynthesis protein FlhF
MNEAVQRVKKELGPDAVILGNRRITVSPSQTLIEITAAVEPEQGPLDPATPATPASPGSEQVQEDLQEIKGLLSMLISSKGYSAAATGGAPGTIFPICYARPG